MRSQEPWTSQLARREGGTAPASSGPIVGAGWAVVGHEAGTPGTADRGHELCPADDRKPEDATRRAAALTSTVGPGWSSSTLRPPRPATFRGHARTTRPCTNRTSSQPTAARRPPATKPTLRAAVPAASTRTNQGHTRPETQRQHTRPANTPKLTTKRRSEASTQSASTDTQKSDHQHNRGQPPRPDPHRQPPPGNHKHQSYALVCGLWAAGWGGLEVVPSGVRYINVLGGRVFAQLVVVWGGWGVVCGGWRERGVDRHSRPRVGGVFPARPPRFCWSAWL